MGSFQADPGEARTRTLKWGRSWDALSVSLMLSRRCQARRV